MNSKYEVSRYEHSCKIDIVNFNHHIINLRERLEQLESIRGLNRILNRTEILKRKQAIEEEIARYQRKINDTRRELNNYSKNGVEYYVTGDGQYDEFQVSRMEVRTQKLEIVDMIELGMM